MGTRTGDFWLCMPCKREPDKDEGIFDVSFSALFDLTAFSRRKDGFGGKNLQKQTDDVLKKYRVERLCAFCILIETHFILYLCVSVRWKGFIVKMLMVNFILKSNENNKPVVKMWNY